MLKCLHKILKMCGSPGLYVTTNGYNCPLRNKIGTKLLLQWVLALFLCSLRWFRFISYSCQRQQVPREVNLVFGARDQ